MKGNIIMGILGKDLIDFDYDFLKFTAMFSNDNIEIEEHTYLHGEILTEFLNYDISNFGLAMKELRILYDEKQEKTFNTVESELIKMIFELPLFRDMKYRSSWFEIKKSSSPYGNLDEFEKLYSDLNLLERYHLFIKEMFCRTKWKVDTNKFATLIYNNGIDAFTSGVSLGGSNFVDPTDITVQYEIRESSNGTVRMYEKMNFTRLIDFLYVDLFKAIMNNYCPKPCKLCGRYFLQHPGLAYEYCTNVAPNETTKNCRDIGSVKSFKDKVKNNPVWIIHQRAYKKYYARMKKKHLSETDFAQWVIEAEQIRDGMLVEYERNNGVNLENYTEEINCIE